ncbi:DUF3293 domain-containing protein [Paucibacter sp. B2R-40]|uniref:DUF3293 domain-containing protein n=1 Tax=Paucibacter sp. B2R-40 TaxID=2893554 RepID=UPI0021E506B3|nr:DUF3293 domain-containing protein [Paucibacter sp. B2R-40]MCV2352631.1 DUF3293 domain-containing protein [Paucibacter sp. B2R-40]
MLESVIDSGLVQAYRKTEYKVHGNEPFTLKVDEASPALAAAHRRHGVNCSAYITAWNPLGLGQEIGVNNQRNSELSAELRKRSLVSIEGVGEPPSDEWSGEASFLIFGVTLEAAKSLGTRWAQNAIIWSGADAMPQLILLR